MLTLLEDLLKLQHRHEHTLEGLYLDVRIKIIIGELFDKINREESDYARKTKRY